MGRLGTDASVRRRRGDADDGHAGEQVLRAVDRRAAV
jgi:hypothetical protein